MWSGNFINKLLILAMLVSISLGINHASGSDDNRLRIGASRTVDSMIDFVYSGAELLRFDFAWVEIEVEDDLYIWEDTRLDTRIQYGENYGFMVVPCVRTGMSWASGFPDPPEIQYPSHVPLDLQDEWNEDYGYSETYYDFISTLVEHYIDHFDYIIIENEIGGPRMWIGEASEYLLLLATAYKAAHDVKPDIKVLSDGTASSVWGLMIARKMLDSGEYSDEEIYEFAEGYYEKHPDFIPMEPELFAYYLVNNDQFLDQKEFIDEELSNLNGIVDIFNYHFCESYWYIPDVINYITEFFSEHGVEVDYLVNDELGERIVVESMSEDDENEFACLVTKNIAETFASGSPHAYWFPFNEQDLEHDKFGIMDDFGEERPSTSTFKFLCEFFSLGYSYDYRDYVADSDVLKTSFKNIAVDDVDFEILWWNDGGHGPGSDSISLLFPENAEDVEIYDFLGDLMDKQSNDGILEMSVSEKPVFLKWNLSSLGTGEPETPPAQAVPGLYPNFPNPFNPVTTIPFVLDDPAEHLFIAIYNVSGKLVKTLADGPYTNGEHRVIWNGETETGRDAASGVYLCKLTAGEISSSMKLVLIK